MANIKSAEKRVLINEKRRIRNKMLNSKLKTSIKRFNESLGSDNKEEMDVLLVKAIKTIDMSVTKGIIHKNTAARKKSNLQRAYNTKIAQ